MESAYLTVDFFRKLPMETDKGGNPTATNADRYTEAHFRRIGSNVSSYVGMVCEALRNSIPKAVVHCQVKEAKQSLLDRFFVEMGKKEVNKHFYEIVSFPPLISEVSFVPQAMQLAQLLDEDPVLMERRQKCAKRLELYKSARDEIDAVLWAI